MIYWSTFFTIAATSLFNFFRDANAKLLSLLAFVFTYLFLLFVVGFRYASIDYFAYEELFNNATFEDFSFPFFTSRPGTTGMEFIWASFSSLFNLIGLPYTAWVFFVALVSLSVKFYYFKKYTPYYLLAIAIYISMGFIKDLGQSRNGLAGAILLFAVRPLIERSFIRFFFVVFIAFGVHVFAVVALPLYWFYGICRKHGAAVFFCLALASLVSAAGGVPDLIMSLVGGSSIVPPGVIHKLEGYTATSASRINFFTVTGLSYIFIATFYLAFKEKVLLVSKESFAFGAMHLYGVLLFLLTTGIDTVSVRSLDLFSMQSLPFLLLTPMYFLKGVTRAGYVAGVILFCALRLYANTDAFADYQNILFVTPSKH